MRSYLHWKVMWIYTACSLWSCFLESSHGGVRFTQRFQMPPYSWKCPFQSPLCSWKWHQIIVCRRAHCCSWKLHQKIPVHFIDLKSLFPSLFFLKRHQKPPQKNIAPQIIYRAITWPQMVPWIFGIIVLESWSGRMKVSFIIGSVSIELTGCCPKPHI